MLFFFLYIQGRGAKLNGTMKNLFKNVFKLFTYEFYEYLVIKVKFSESRNDILDFFFLIKKMLF